MVPLPDVVKRGLQIMNITPNYDLFNNQERLRKIYADIIEFSREYVYIISFFPDKYPIYLDIIETRAFIRNLIQV